MYTPQAERASLDTLPDKWIIRTSDRLQFKKCRRAWDLGSKIRQNYEPNRSARPLVFGTCVHAGMEVYYDPKTWHDNDVKQIFAMQAFLDAIELSRKDYLDRMNRPDLDPLEQEEFDEDKAMGISIMKTYFKWAPSNDKFTPTLSEIEFEVPVKVPEHIQIVDLPLGFKVDDNDRHLHYLDRPVVYQGRIDILVIDDYGHYWIVDHKTAKAFKDTEWLDFDEQCGSYCWALQELLGLKIDGVIYSELKKVVAHPPAVLKSGQLSKNKQQNTTYELYMQAIAENNLNPSDYTDFLEMLKESDSEKFFRRTKVIRNQAELKNLGIQIFQEAVEMLSGPTIYPTGGQNCGWCDFSKVCRAMNEDSDYQWILNDLYHKRNQTELQEVN